MRVLVMGGTGEVGHHVANGLAQRRHDVVVLARGQDRRGFERDERVRCIQADKNDIAALDRALAPLVFDVVIDTVPSEASLRNVHGLFAGKIRHYIHCSSTGVYAPLRYVPGDEEHPWEPSPGDFFAACAARDRLALELFSRSGFPVTILRPTMIIGPGALPVDNLGGRSAQFLQDLAANRPIELPEDGDALVQGGLNADLAQAFVLASEQPDRAIGQIFNISCQRAVTLRDYLGFFKEAMGSTSALVPTPIATILANHPTDGRADEYWLRFLCLHMCYDISKARARLGYDPPSDLRHSVQLVVQWAKQANRI
ncbi:NAD-dependent epimerase/dehydratase family protein [bacterium]|nr:NAD-dependent epimerase/dehydratase family protein [bacterium]